MKTPDREIPGYTPPIMLRCRSALIPVIVAIWGCDPDDVPRYSPDGARIAVLLDSGKDRDKDVVAVALVDVARGETRRHELPDRWSAGGLVWAGPRLLLTASRPKSVQPDKKGEPTHDLRYWLLDAATGAFEETKLQPRIFTTPFMSLWKGKTCLFVGDPERGGTQILSLPELVEIDALPFEVEGAGEGRLIRTLRAGENAAFAGVDVLDSEGKTVRTIERGEIAKACHRDARRPECGRVSSDGTLLVLGFDTDTLFRQAETEFTFGVFDLRSGKLVRSGGSNALRGLPVVQESDLYVLEARTRKIPVGERGVGALTSGAPSRSQPTSEVVLARHHGEGREVLLELPLKKTDRAARYSASPDRKTFVLQVEGPEPRLVVIPIGRKVDAKDLREISLR